MSLRRRLLRAAVLGAAGFAGGAAAGTVVTAAGLYAAARALERYERALLAVSGRGLAGAVRLGLVDEREGQRRGPADTST